MSTKRQPRVSVRTIRDAIKWSNLPVPKVSIRDEWAWPSGSIARTFTIVWDRAKLETVLGEKITHDGSAGYTRFLDKLRNAFCADIVVGNCFSQQDELVIAELYASLGPDFFLTDK